MAQLGPALPIRMRIQDDAHAVIISQQAFRLAGTLQFSRIEQTALSIAVLEIARNIVKYAGSGEVEITPVCSEGATEIVVVAEDQGPGIPDLELALEDGFSTGKSLGLGLPGARRLMDSFDIVSAPGKGTTIRMKKVKHDR